MPDAKPSESPAPPSSWTKTRSDLALTIKRDPGADTTELRRKLRAERLEEHVQRVVEQMPPLTADQLDRIARLLSITPTGGQAA